MFDRMTERNWAIVAELETVAKQAGRTMAQVAINWVANRPGVGSVILGATRLAQLEDTMAALDFELASGADGTARCSERAAAAVSVHAVHA